MKNRFLPLVLGLSLFVIFCKNESPKTAEPATADQSAAPAARPDLNQPAAAQPLPANPQAVQNQAVNSTASAQNQSASQPQPVTNIPANAAGEQPKPRPEMPDDAECFASLNTDGRLFEIRLAMVDEKRVTGDLLVRNIKTGEFVQGKLSGELREKIKYFLTWVYTGDDKKRHIINLSYFRDGERLIERSQDKEADGRVFKKARCSDFK